MSNTCTDSAVHSREGRLPASDVVPSAELEVSATELEVAGVELEIAGVELDVVTTELELFADELELYACELEVAAMSTKSLQSKLILCEKSQKNPIYDHQTGLQFGIKVEKLATGQEKALDTVHIAKANLNVIFLSNLGALISDIAFVKGSTDRVVHNGIFSIFERFMQIFNNGTIKLMQAILVFQLFTFNIGFK